MAFDADIERGRREKELTEAIEKMTKAELVQYAEYNNIEIDKSAKKADLKADVLEIIKAK